LGGIFSQKSADLKSVAKQIALLQLYIGWVEKGYQIAREGLTTIGEIKNGEFNLHAVFFNSLSSVNPAIRKYSRIGIIISDQTFIVQHFKKVLEIRYLTADEGRYVQTIYSNMIDASTSSLNELINLISDDEYKMCDDERVKRIDRIYDDMEGKVALTKTITGQVSVLSAQRAAEENDLEFLQNLE
jgi:hypothetical protein